MTVYASVAFVVTEAQRSHRGAWKTGALRRASAPDLYSGNQLIVKWREIKSPALYRTIGATIANPIDGQIQLPGTLICLSVTLRLAISPAGV